MKLVIIYGPPAAGKHTIGKKLSELTGYKFFYNHLTVDVVRVLFDDEDERRNELLSNVRLPVIEAAVRYDMSTVLTVGFAGDSHGRLFIKRAVKAVTDKGGTAHFVRLNPPDATLFERVGKESRRELRKTTSADGLSHLLETRNFREILDYPSSMDLVTSKLTPEESARDIIRQFDLQEL